MVDLISEASPDVNAVLTRKQKYLVQLFSSLPSEWNSCFTIMTQVIFFQINHSVIDADKTICW